MDTATLINKVATPSMPSYVIVDYQYVMGTDSTSFISVDLPALSVSQDSYRNEMRKGLTGKAYVIDLCSISISAGSTNFDVHLLNKGGASYLNTIYEVKTITGINLSESDAFNKFIICNNDDAMTNKLYFQLVNNAAASMETVLIQLTYVVLQDREA